MFFRSTMSPCRVALVGPRPRALLVPCSKVHTEDSLHPRVRRLLEADPQLAHAVQENPRLLRKLGLLYETPKRGGRKRSGIKVEYAYVSFITEANSYGEVAALFRSALNQDAANVVTTNAVFDRLRALKASRSGGSHHDLQAAFQVALQEALQRLPEADPRSLSALARAAYHLGLPVPQEHHQRIVAKFLGLMEALQERNAAQPTARWQQPTFLPDGLSNAPLGCPEITEAGSDSRTDSTNISAAKARGATTSVVSSSGSNSGSLQPYPVQPGTGERSVRTELEQGSQSLANFVWAILSNSQWQLQDGQLAALMECVQVQPMSLPLQCTQVLVGLVRYAASRGEAAVRPYVQEGGAAEVSLRRVLRQLSKLNVQNCSDTIMSIGNLQLRCPPGTLAALVGQALADVERKSLPPRKGFMTSLVCSIGILFRGFFYASGLSPEECRAALQLPAARWLAQEFSSRVKGLRDYGAWIDMLTACCWMRFNPPVGSQRVPLLVSLLEHFPAMSGRVSLFDGLEMLGALRHVYGLPDRETVVEELQPYRKNLAYIARGVQQAIQQDPQALEPWRAVPRNRSVKVDELLAAYASLL